MNERLENGRFRAFMGGISVGPGNSLYTRHYGRRYSVCRKKITIVKSEYCPMPEVAKMTTSTRLF